MEVCVVETELHRTSLGAETDSVRKEAIHFEVNST